MTAVLPTADNLRKLPLRAVVAYAARTARRLSEELRGVVADDVLDDVLREIESPISKLVFGEKDGASVARAAHCIVHSYAAVPPEAQSTERFRLVYSITRAALAATRLINAVEDPEHIGVQMKYAAKSAQSVVNGVKALDKMKADAAIAAAIFDYEELVREFGLSDELRIGDPIIT